MSLIGVPLRAAIGTLNVAGRSLDALGVDTPRLESGALRKLARRRTGLEDFGAWPIDEPLERLLESYRNEAKLTMLGKLTVREMLVSLLENLLHIEHERSRQPSVTDETIAAPVFIVGLPRTGTTLLHGLLTEDPASRVPLTWEVMYPAGYPNEPDAIEAVRRRTAGRLEWANRLAPEFRRIHPLAPDFAQECIAITAQVFMSIQFHTTHNVPSYEDWFEAANHGLAYDFHYRLLQHLQARRAGSRWVLKAPGHLFSLRALLERYPDAKIVQTHRDPLRVMASMASHATVLRRAFSQAADPLAIAADWAKRWADALDDFLAVRDTAPATQFFDVGYESLEQAPIETVEEIYRFIDAPLGAEAKRRMQAFLRANPKNKHGAHRYSLAQFGLDRADLLARFAEYCERFEIEVGSLSRAPGAVAPLS
jgi:hypothetical protein